MSKNQALIINYLRAISGQPKPADVVARFVADVKLTEHISQVESASPRYELVADELLEDGDKVVVRGTFRGVQEGPFAGIPPTHRSVSAGLIIVYRIENGRIVEHWMQFDLFSVLGQLREGAARA